MHNVAHRLTPEAACTSDAAGANPRSARLCAAMAAPLDGDVARREDTEDRLRVDQVEQPRSRSATSRDQRKLPGVRSLRGHHQDAERRRLSEAELGQVDDDRLAGDD